MKIKLKDFRVKPDEKVELKEPLTIGKPFYKSKAQYQQILGEHVQNLSVQHQRLLPKWQRQKLPRCRVRLRSFYHRMNEGDFSIMNKTLIAKATITINAPPPKVWDALTKPDLIKQYLFGTEVTTDWQVGSPITYKGIWESKAYEDKGRVLQIEPGKLLVSTFWSSLSGLPDIPENYKTVRYELSTEGNGTRLTITQDNNDSQEEASHSEQNWKAVLDGVKKLIEG